jgi:imidazolonepropionase-like amidohydrolase
MKSLISRVGGARFLLQAILALSIVFFVDGCSRPHIADLAIIHATIIDATGAAPQPDMTLLIANQRITAIGPSAVLDVPRGTRVVDGTGKFIIPGLVDMHLHLTGAGEPGGSREFFLPLLIANGITTVRDMGGYLESLIPLRQEINQGKRLGPQILFAGPYLDGNPPSFQPSLVGTNSVEASEDVRSLIQRGVDFIKVQSNLSRPAYFAIAAVCKREHISFIGHVPDRVTVAEASDAGQKSIEHLTGILLGCSRKAPRLLREQFLAGPKYETPAQSHERELAWQRKLLSTYSEKKAAELFDTFVRNQTWQVPTLILLKQDAFPTPESDPSKDPRREYVPKHFLEGWEKGTAERDKEATQQEFELRTALLAKSIQLVGKMQLAGVRIMAGTDSAAPYVFPGSALHEELALLVQAGLTPMQALQAATRSPAEFLGKLETQGTVEPGKFADLLLLDADPLADIHNTQKIHAVILRGKFLDRDSLDGMLKSVIEFAMRH